jgi:hypothetical protein
MNIFSACSITGGRAVEPVYQAMVAALVSDGHPVPTAPLAESGAGEKKRFYVLRKCIRAMWVGFVPAMC